MYKVTPLKVSYPMQKALSEHIAIRGIQLGNKQIGLGLKREGKRGITQGPKSGRLYIINGKLHRASAPGEYPANLTGKLKKSIDFEQDQLEMEFGADTKYAPILQQYEDANQRSSIFTKIAPRPFLTLAHDNESPKFVAKMYASFAKVTGVGS